MLNAKCTICTRRMLHHKSRIKCSLCETILHPKCAGLTPSNISHMDMLGILDTWFCHNCNVNIFPYNLLENFQNSKNADRCHNKREHCTTCNKLGNINQLVACENCDLKSHKRCFAGVFGCKSCARNIIPGYDVNITELFGTFGKNNARFNPFDPECDLSNIGSTNIFNDVEGHEDWSFCSQILNNCKYVDPDTIKCSRDSEIKIFSYNIRNLKDNIETINERIEHFSKFDVLCFNETNCSILKLPFGGKELELAQFHPPIIQAPARKSSRGGGLIIYLNKKFCSINDYKILTNLSCNSDPSMGEFLFVEITRKAKNIIIGNMYRSPSHDSNLFITELEHRLELLNKHKNKHIILTSDSNIDLLQFQSFEPANNLVNCLSEHGFLPVISIPTRITDHSATLIDHIFVNSGLETIKSSVIIEDMSDHLATFVGILIDPNKCDKMLDNNSYRPINDENLINWKHDIGSVDWNFVNNIESADEKFTKFKNKYNEIYEKHFPIKPNKNSKRKYDKPWLLPWLQGAIDRKNNMYRQFIKQPTIANKIKYTKLKKFCTKHIKLAKRKYYDNYFQQYCNDGRKKWQMVNKLLNRNSKSKIGITKLKKGDNEVTNPKDIAETFNDFFCTVAQKLKTGDQNSHDHIGGHTLTASTRNFISMEDTACTDFEIENYIKSLKNKATSDFAVKPLKIVGDIISPVLSHLISASLIQGVFPSSLKIAKVIPVHKKCSRADVSNYRPISLLSCFSKIFEKAMHFRLTSFLRQNNIISDSQYGFRAGHSCEHALLDAHSKITTALDRKKITLLLLIDFSKAFDMVDHGILLHKLEHYGIRQHHLNWFRSYLTDRSQRVHINNHVSELSRLQYSVPQGSILGPVLFIIYINDLPLISKLAKYVFYADDANIIVTADDELELKHKINTILQALNSWVAGNGLKLNLQKTKYMIFTNRRKINREMDLFLNGVKIEYSECERFLGVMMDSNLSWTKHINLLSAKISRNAGIIYKLKGKVPQSVLKNLYDSFIQSHLNYCSSVWGLGSKSSLQSLFRAQKKSVRAIDNKYNILFYNKDTGETPCHTKEIFKKYNILTVYNLVAKNCLILMQKARLNVNPTNIQKLFNTVNEFRPRRDPVYFSVPYSRLKSLDKTIEFKGPRLYNEVVHAINEDRNTCNNKLECERFFIARFKTHVTQYLLAKQSTGGVDWTEGNFLL